MTPVERSSIWRPLTGAPAFTPTTLAELLDGGQAFRWHRQRDDTWQGQWSDHDVYLRLAATGQLEWTSPLPPDAPSTFAALDATSVTPSAPSAFVAPSAAPAAKSTATPPNPDAALRRYLAIDDEAHDRALDALPWRSDPHLATCLAAFPGLRILRQPFGETLLAFLCSATKQIIQIKQMLALLAEHHGTCNVLRYKPTPPAPPVCNVLRYKLPTWPQLAAASEADLRACQLGFRARYIKATADFLAAHPGWLEETGTLPYAVAKARLLTLPGVGEKIADCVLLFGANQLAAFPVDTWMIKSMARRYGLDGWSPTQIAHFGRTHFGAAAGLAQQYLFAWERAFGGR